MGSEILIFLPGMMCDERLFAPQIAALSGNHNIIVPGLTEETISGMAKSVLEKAGDHKINLVGLSMGGIVAMAMLDLAPQQISRLALLDTNHLADPAERYAIRNRQIEDVKQGKLREVIVEEMKPVYLAMENRQDEALLALLIDMAMDVGPETFVAQSLALRDRPEQTASLQNYAGKSLVLCGEEDALCPPERHHQMAELLGEATLDVIAGAGHISTLEQPERVTAALQNWLEA